MAYKDVVERYLGEELPHRFLEVQKKGLLGRLFGGMINEFVGLFSFNPSKQCSRRQGATADLDRARSQQRQSAILSTRDEK